MEKSPKIDLLEQLRTLIERKIPEALETNYAEVDMLALSFQSRIHSERHVYVYTYGEALLDIDLEDWLTDEEWDNAVARHSASSLDEAVEIIYRWIAGIEPNNGVK